MCKCPAAISGTQLSAILLVLSFPSLNLGRENTVCFPPPPALHPPEKQKKSALLTGLRDCRKSFHHRQFRSCPKLEDVFLAYVPTSQHRSAKSAPHPQIYRTPSLVGSEIYLGHPPLNSTDIFCKWICQLVILVTLK